MPFSPPLSLLCLACWCSMSVYKRWCARVNTGLLNRWFQKLKVLKPPPASFRATVRPGRGKAKTEVSLKLKFLCQVRAVCLLGSLGAVQCGSGGNGYDMVAAMAGEHSAAHVCAVCQPQ